MPNKVLNHRSITPGNRPTGRDPGEFWVNFADGVLGYIDDNGQPVDLTTIPVTIGDAPPIAPASGELWFDSVGGQLYVYFDDGSSQQWVIAVNAMQDLSGYALRAELDGYLPLVGGTLTGHLDATTATLTGHLIGTSGTFSDNVSAAGLYVEQPTGGAVVFMNTPAAGVDHVIFGVVNGQSRWAVNLGDATPEGGGNSGSNFVVGSYSDAGAITGAALRIYRASGDMETVSRINAGKGYGCRFGVGGALSPSQFNFAWDGGAGVQSWIDTSLMGTISFISDYRIKKDITALPSMWDTVKALNPISYTFRDYTPPGTPLKEDGGEPDPFVIGSDKERWGFVAHELQETLIEDAATGVKDQDNCIQSPNWPPIVAALTRALQEAMARIEALEASR